MTRSDKKDLYRGNKKWVPVIVPCTIEPFLSCTVTLSLFNFIKNLWGFERDISFGNEH